MDHTRHEGIFIAKDLSVTLVGADGIGAMTALALVKMGVGGLTFFDGDTVGPENMPTQLHRLGTEGQWKVEALKNTLLLFADDTYLDPRAERVSPNFSLYGGVVISAVDSIQARKDIWQAVKNGKAGYYIDARMSAEEYHQYCVPMDNPEKVDKYASLIGSEDDSQILDAPCTSKATFYTAATSAGHLGSAVRKIVTGFIPPYYLVHNIFRDKLLVLEH